MTWFFLICAVVGGTVLICQFVLTLVGLGGHDVDFSHDVPHDFPAMPAMSAMRMARTAPGMTGRAITAPRGCSA